MPLNTTATPQDSPQAPPQPMTPKAPLPGLVLLFLVQLYGGLLAFIGLAITALMGSRYDSIFLLFSLGSIIGGIWVLSIILKIHSRAPAAPKACATFLMVALVLGGLGAIALACALWHYWESELLTLTTSYIVQLIASYAYWEYFRRSNSVQKCFLSPPLSTKPSLPLSVGLLQIFCVIQIAQYCIMPLPLWGKEDNNYSYFSYLQEIPQWAGIFYIMAAMPFAILLRALLNRLTPKHIIHASIGLAIATNFILHQIIPLFIKGFGTITFFVPFNAFLNFLILILLWWGLTQEKEAQHWFRPELPATVPHRHWLIAFEQALAAKRLPLLLMALMAYIFVDLFAMINFSMADSLQTSLLEALQKLNPSLILNACAIVIGIACFYAMLTQNSHVPLLILLFTGLVAGIIGYACYITPPDSMRYSIGFYAGQMFVLGCISLYVLRSPYIHWLYGNAFLPSWPTSARPLPVTILLGYFLLSAIQFGGKLIYQYTVKGTSESYDYSYDIINDVGGGILTCAAPLIIAAIILRNGTRLSTIKTAFIVWFVAVAVVIGCTGSNIFWGGGMQMYLYEVKEISIVIAAALWYFSSSTEVRQWLGEPTNNAM